MHDLMRILTGFAALIVPLALLYSKWRTEDGLVRRVRENALPVSAPLSKSEAAYLHLLIGKGVVCNTAEGVYALNDQAFELWSKRRQIVMYLVVAWIAGLITATVCLLS
jgi:hypothetical protein